MAMKAANQLLSDRQLSTPLEMAEYVLCGSDHAPNINIQRYLRLRSIAVAFLSVLRNQHSPVVSFFLISSRNTGDKFRSDSWNWCLFKAWSTLNQVAQTSRKKIKEAFANMYIFLTKFNVYKVILKL
jgi:hypothetical protein